MNKAAILAAIAIALGSLMVALDLAYAPNLSLLAADSTILSVLTVMVVALLVARSVRPAGKETEAVAEARRMPVDEMAELLRGALDGYTLNRKEISHMLRSALDAKKADEQGPPSHEDVDAYLRSVLGHETFSQFLSEDAWRDVRVKSSQEYLTHLRNAVTLLSESLGF